MFTLSLLSPVPTVHLFKLKTYHEVVDEIYYQVKHLEPWERGSRKTAGQTGMCGGVSMFFNILHLLVFYLLIYEQIANCMWAWCWAEYFCIFSPAGTLMSHSTNSSMNMQHLICSVIAVKYGSMLIAVST